MTVADIVSVTGAYTGTRVLADRSPRLGRVDPVSGLCEPNVTCIVATGSSCLILAIGRYNASDVPVVLTDCGAIGWLCAEEVAIDI